MYKDKSLSSEERAKALLAEMSLEEKFFQLSSDMIRETSGENIRRYEKSLDFQGFFAIERQRGRQNF